MKENWIQLIDRREKDPFETEAFVALMEYVGEASDEDKRRVVQEVERRIKMIARYDADKSFRFRKFSEQEREVLDSLWSTRVRILNEMMLHPTDAEIARLGHQNDKLRELSKDAFAQGRNLWKSLLHSPSLMANEDYYFRDSGRYSYGEPLVADDGTNWNLDYLDNQAFDKFCICHLMHSLHSHEYYSLPDILRMDDFYVHVWLQYEREVYQWKKGNVIFKEEVNGKGMEKTDR